MCVGFFLGFAFDASSANDHVRWCCWRIAEIQDCWPACLGCFFLCFYLLRWCCSYCAAFLAPADGEPEGYQERGGQDNQGESWNFSGLQRHLFLESLPSRCGRVFADVLENGVIALLLRDMAMLRALRPAEEHTWLLSVVFGLCSVTYSKNCALTHVCVQVA